MAANLKVICFCAKFVPFVINVTSSGDEHTSKRFRESFRNENFVNEKHWPESTKFSLKYLQQFMYPKFMKWLCTWYAVQLLTLYSVFHLFSQAKFANCGSILSLNQILLLLKLPQKMKLVSKVVKINAKKWLADNDLNPWNSQYFHFGFG